MSLEEYSRKRRFEETPEPKPVKGKTEGHRFFVQRHHASHLHYDFRLEIDGTLKSWAIPKGPTLDPAPKRLAAMVEDHPIDYGDFEGNIPAGNYGAGSVMLWDRGTFELIGDTPARDQIARGDLKFRLAGEKLNGEFALVLMKGRGKGNEWLLLKKKDEAATPDWDVEGQAFSVKTGRTQEQIAHNAPAVDQKTSDMPRSIKPMSAEIAQAVPKGEDWAIEIKWDGIRALCFVDGGKLEIYTRNGNRCDRQYPELAVLPNQLKAKQAIVDGEIAVLDPKGVSRFALIQPRIMNSDAASIALMARKRPVKLFLFDLLYLDGKDLRKQPLRERKKLLAKILKPSDEIRLSDYFEGDPETVIAAVKEQGLEGVIAKRLSSEYQGRRSSDWRKIKLVSQQEFVICGYIKGERDYFGALVLGFHEKGKLLWAGNVGAGFDRKMMKSIWDAMQPLIVDECPLADKPKIRDVTWLRPELVCQVKFQNWTEDHKLRAPVFLGMRQDVDADDTVREEPGVNVRLTNLDRIYFPKEGYTKGQLIKFYDDVADLLLPHLKDRPLSLKRYPNGIHEEYFFQKNSPPSYPEWLRFETIDGIRYVLVEDRAALQFLTNQGCIDQNPWMSRVGTLENPDWVLIDLDPQSCSYDKIVEAALLVRKALDALELEGYAKTTGGDGMHIYVPVEPVYTYDQTKMFAEAISRIVIRQQPELFTTPRSVEKRQKDKVYFDYLQNGEGKTIAAPYVVRAYDGAPVATPLAWREVKKGLLPSKFTIKNAVQRFGKVGDLFEGVLKKKQRIEGSFVNLEKLLRG